MLFDHNLLNLLFFILSIIASVILLIFICYIGIKAHQKTIVSGEEALIGMEAVVLSVHKDYIIVRLLGEIWQAESTLPVKQHQRVKIIKSNGLILTVKPDLIT